MEGSEKTYLRILSGLKKIRAKIKKEIEDEAGVFFLSFIDIKGKEKPCNQYARDIINERKSK